MRGISLTKNDIGYHFRKNSSYYISFMVSIILALIIAIIIIISNEGYLSLLVSNNKILYSLINGTATLNNIFFSRLTNFSFPMLLILILGLNYYLCFFSFVIVMYQFVVFIMTAYAIIDIYGFGGILSDLFLIVPVNLIFFVILIFLSVVCIERGKEAERNRYFAEGYNGLFFVKVGACFLMVILLSLVVAFIFPLILKSAIFSIF